MPNTETMQLDLFNGVILNTKQQEQIDDFTKRQATRVVTSKENVKLTMLLMDEAGFVQGKDYISNFEVHEVTKECQFGSSYNNTNFEHEVTYMNATGGIYLIVNNIKDGELEVYKSSVDRDGVKLMCTTITEQYRYYKPSSLYTKFNEYNDRKINELEHKGKQKIAVGKIIAKYKKLYPKAVVRSGTDYYRSSYTSFPIVKVKFPSGSEISFTLGYGDEMEKEILHKRYDAVTETVEQSLEKYNNQKAK
tara:strand:- start:459 stop:1205 length:747 start_codon:yes stop_codon:yes gene_type:complete